MHRLATKPDTGISVSRRVIRSGRALPSRLADALDTTTDYLITGTRAEESQLANIRLLRRFQAVVHMAEEDQQTVMRVLDAFIAQQRMASVPVPVD